MEKLTDAEKTNLALALIYTGKKLPSFVLEANRELARKLGILEQFEFLEKRFEIEMPSIEKNYQAGKKNKN